MYRLFLYVKKIFSKAISKDIPIRNENDSKKHQLGDDSSLSGNNNDNLNSDEYILITIESEVKMIRNCLIINVMFIQNDTLWI